jgi:hypothetical protein
VSLTSLIKQKGPFRLWLEGNFANTKSVASSANQQLRVGVEQCPFGAPTGSDRGLVGSAVGYAISASIRSGALESSVATHGAVMLETAFDERFDPAPSKIERSVVARIATLHPWIASATATDWEEMADLSLILARFEQFFRAGLPIAQYIIPALDAGASTLRELAAAMANEITRRDTAVVARIGCEDHAYLRVAASVEIGPVFTQSEMLGGADGDLIYDGTLIDFKSSSAKSVIGRDELWQLLGYLLADTEDRFGIHSVGFGALRWRSRVIWDAQEYVNRLMGGEARAIPRLRADFQSLLSRCA